MSAITVDEDAALDFMERLSSTLEFALDAQRDTGAAGTPELEALQEACALPLSEDWESTTEDALLYYRAVLDRFGDASRNSYYLELCEEAEKLGLATPF